MESTCQKIYTNEQKRKPSQKKKENTRKKEKKSKVSRAYEIDWENFQNFP